MKAQLTALVSALCAVAAHATLVYWDGTGGSWNAVASWSTSPSATTPNPASVPGSANTAVFNIDSVSGAQTVALGAHQAAMRLTVQGTATGGVTLAGGGADRTLSLGTGGMAVSSGAGPVVIGATVAGQGVTVSMTGSQAWTNGSANAVVVRNGIGETGGARTLRLMGTGGFHLEGPGTYTGRTTLTNSLMSLAHGSALGLGDVSLAGGTARVDDFPRQFANKFVMDNTAARRS